MFHHTPLPLIWDNYPCLQCTSKPSLICVHDENPITTYFSSYDLSTHCFSPIPILSLETVRPAVDLVNISEVNMWWQPPIPLCWFFTLTYVNVILKPHQFLLKYFILIFGIASLQFEEVKTATDLTTISKSKSKLQPPNTSVGWLICEHCQYGWGKITI